MDILAEGQVLLDKTRKIYDKNLLKKDTFTSARLSYVMKKKEMEATFRSHRSKALLIFRSNPRVLQQLAIDGKYPRVHDL